MMTRLILPFLVAFVVAVAGGSALVLVKAKDAHSAALDRYAELKAKADSAAKAAPHGADSTAHDMAATAGDSTAAHGTAGSAGAADAAHAPPAAPVPVTVPPPGKPGATGAPMPTTPAKPAPTDVSAPAAAPAPASAAAPTKDAASAADVVGTEKKLAKIFAAMPPKEAAKVLQQMEDADVRVILGHLGPRQAASVLASFPPARAATFSQQQLKGSVVRTASH